MRVYVIAALVVFMGLAWWSMPSGSCAARVESGVERAFVAAWEALLDEKAESGQNLSASRLLRTERGLQLLRRVERIARDSVEGAEWAEPSSSDARRWFQAFVDLVEAAAELGVADQPLEALELEWIAENQLSLTAQAGAQTFQLEIVVSCDGDRPQRLRARGG